MGVAAMNLYDLMGPVAIAVGVGASYGASKATGVSWLVLGVALVVGCAVLVAMRHITTAVRPGALPVMYVATPLAVVCATFASARGLYVLLQ